MGWQLSGRSVELCSCNSCAHAGLVRRERPTKAGAVAHLVSTFSTAIPTDLDGTKVAFTAEWPGNFLLMPATSRCGQFGQRIPSMPQAEVFVRPIYRIIHGYSRRMRK